MKLIPYLSVLLALSASALPSTSQARARIDIDHDEDDCLDGWISMDVTVRVDGESFKFNPSCSFSFSKRFKTNSGLECKVEAGMCSGFFPENKIEVSCEDYSSESVTVDCPKDIKFIE